MAVDDFDNQKTYASTSNDGSQSPTTLSILEACLVIAYVGVVLRFVSRRLGRLKVLPDDWLIVLAVFVNTVAVAIGFLCIKYGVGKHEATYKNRAFPKSAFAYTILHLLTIALVKLSLTFLYRRAFPCRTLKLVLTLYGTFVTLYTLIFTLLYILHCSPPSNSWNGINNSCLNTADINVITGTLDSITSFFALGLPMSQILLQPRDAIAWFQIGGVFIVGLFVSIVSVLRVVEYAHLANSMAFSYEYATLLNWSTVELSIGIFAACLPVMKPLCNYVMRSTPLNPLPTDRVGDPSGPKDFKRGLADLIGLPAPSDAMKSAADQRKPEQLSERSSSLKESSGGHKMSQPSISTEASIFPRDANDPLYVHTETGALRNPREDPVRLNKKRLDSLAMVEKIEKEAGPLELREMKKPTKRLDVDMI